MDDEGDLFLTGQTGQFLVGHTREHFQRIHCCLWRRQSARLQGCEHSARCGVQQSRRPFSAAAHYRALGRCRANAEQDAVHQNHSVMRLNSYDCANYYQTNLVPEYYLLDDYQVTTPTDIIGQHIHLPKWDLVAADGAANGWNYEDGALGAESVHRRIDAINRFNLEEGTGGASTDGKSAPLLWRRA